MAHCEQNFAVGGLTVPHVGHGDATALPHSMQNLASARFAVPQFQQFNGVPLRPPGASARAYARSQPDQRARRPAGMKKEASRVGGLFCFSAGVDQIGPLPVRALPRIMFHTTTAMTAPMTATTIVVMLMPLM